MPSLTIDGLRIEIEAGATLLRAIEKLGKKVPTLCHHPGLPEYGACRLCMVEVHQEKRAPVLQAACSYRVQDGISVFTDSERVKRTRRVVAELLLARCPDSEAIRKLAAGLGVHEPRFAKKDDDCVYCGLCERMCRVRMGRAALGFTGRGSRRRLEPPYGRHNPRCWACGACDFICPVGKRVSRMVTDKPLRPILNHYNLDLDGRSAISVLYPQAVPNTPAIDAGRCVHLSQGACGMCQDICQAGAIDFDQVPRTEKLEVGAIVLTPGVELFDARLKKQYGYGSYPNVITSMHFERILSASGPFAGHVQRPSDGKTPGRIAFIQCVGSRDTEHDYCSSVCCMYATKEAVIAKEHVGGKLECDIFFMDVRAFGKGFEEYYQRALKQGVNYIRCRPAAVEEIPESGNLRIAYLTESDEKAAREYDLVVLSVGMQAPGDAAGLARTFGLELDQNGFCKTSAFAPVSTGRQGIYVAGAFTGPKDIPESVMQGSAAAALALADLHDQRFSLTASREYPPEIDVAGQPPKVGVFVCHCGANIASVVGVHEVAEYAATLPDVAHAQTLLYACSTDSQTEIRSRIKELGLNRVVVASCTPRTHLPLFQETLREQALNPYLFEMANIRDQCSWVHRDHPEAATRKAKDLVRMAVAKARLLEPLAKRSMTVNKAALVLGGGLSGMTAANLLADQGFDVFLVEKTGELGGQLGHIHTLLGGEDPRRALRELAAKTRAQPRIRLFLDATVDGIEGSVGRFTTTVSSGGVATQIAHGVVIIATGAQSYRPAEHLYGEDDRVMTQVELEQRLAAEPDWLAVKKRQRPKTVVMIQCVGSRDAERPYCSRLCCAEAIKNALTIKRRSPDTHVYVLYRDVRVYGMKERFYSEARQRDVVFIRYDADNRPVVARAGNGDRGAGGPGLRVEVLDATLGQPIAIAADHVVLSAGLVANPENEAIAKLLKVPRGSDGFFLEAHMKLRPAEFATAGVYVCGLAHGAKSVEESIAQAQAAVARAAPILARDQLELDANISEVSYDNCDGCAYCIDPCPAKAITLFEYLWKGAVKKAVDVDPALCLGCGSCQATCPKGGTRVLGFTLDQLAAQVHAALEAS